MMEVVIPDRVETKAALCGRADKSGILRLVLPDDNDALPVRGGSRSPRQLGYDILAGVVEDLLRGVEPQPVEVEFADPIASVLANILSDWRTVAPVKVQRLSPFVRIFVRRIGLRELSETVAARPKMIVDD